MRRVSSSKSKMNSRPVPSLVIVRPSFVKTVMRGPNSVRRTVGIDCHAVHQVEHLGRVGLAGAGQSPRSIG